jgi:hypothetical protein
MKALKNDSKGPIYAQFEHTIEELDRKHKLLLEKTSILVRPVKIQIRGTHNPSLTAHIQFFGHRQYLDTGRLHRKENQRHTDQRNTQSKSHCTHPVLRTQTVFRHRKTS